MRVFLSYFLLMTCIYVCSGQEPYNYTDVIRLSNIFYQIQEQIISPENEIPWKVDCFLDDGQDVGRNLAGGHFDGGDFTKFHFPYASFVTMLNWGIIDWFNGYDPSVLNQTIANVRVALEYLVRLHPEPNVIYGQIGIASLDHALWERCQDWPLGPRRTFQINSTAPGSELASEFAAAFASGFLIFEHRDEAFARQLLQHAIDAYEFAYNYRGLYSDSIPEARDNYNSWSGYGDDLGWGAVWLLRATNNVRSYKSRLDILWCQQNYHAADPTQFSWDDKLPGVFVLGNRVLNDIDYGESRYREKAIEYCDKVMNLEQTEEGLTWLGDHGPLRLALNAAFVCLNLAEQTGQSNIPNADQYRAWARSQIHYVLGDTGRSFVIGYGQNPPINAHHRQSSCPAAPATCGWNFHNSDQDNSFECTGGLVRGPDRNETFVDQRQLFEHTDVALDFNAGLQSTMAALNQLQLQGKI